MARACHTAIPAKYEREGLVAKDFAYPECFEYPLRHGDHDPKSGKRLSKETQLELTKGRVRNAASRFAQFGKNIPGSDRGRVKSAIDRAKALHGIGDRSTPTPNRANTGEHMTTNANAEMLRTLANRPGVSTEAKKKLLAQAAKAEGKAEKPAAKKAAAKSSKPAAAKPAKKKASKPKAAKKAAAKKAKPAKAAAAKKPAAKKAAKPKTTKAAAKPAAKKAAKKAPKKKETTAQAKKARAAGSKKAAAKKASTHKKAPMATTETKTEEKAEAKAAAATPKKNGKGKGKAKTAKAKAKAKSKGKKTTAKKAKPKAKKAKSAAKSKKAATPKKTSPKKKAGKKKTAKKSAAKAAPKKASKSKSKGKGKKKAAKKAKPVATAAAAPAPTPKKTSPKKKAGKKKASKAKAKKTGAVKKSTSLSYAGAKVPPAVKKATKSAKKVSQTTKYRDKAGNTSIVHRMFNPATPPAKSSPVVNLAILAGGGVVGWTVTDMVDRLVATRAQDATYPWYSTDAAERIMLRPDGMRLASQAGVTVAFFLGSMLAHEKMPRFAYFLAGAAVGSVIHWAGQVITTMAMPRLLKAEKGNERTLANRLYPMEQLAVQTPAIEAVDAENKNWKTAIGQQNGKTPAELPDAYLWPTASSAPATAPTQASSTAQTTGRVAGVAGVYTTRLPAGRPTIQYPAARPAAQPVQATPRAGAFVGEPVARAQVRTAPLSQQKPGVVGCGGQGCGKCSACKRPDADVDNGYQDGLNVAVTSPRPQTELPPVNMPRQPVEVIPSGPDASVPQVDTTQPRGMSKVGDAMVRAVGTPNAFTRHAAAANGRPVGRVRPRLDAGLLGSTNTSRQAHMGGRGAGRMN